MMQCSVFSNSVTFFRGGELNLLGKNLTGVARQSDKLALSWVAKTIRIA
jgi:hypothetical protein